MSDEMNFEDTLKELEKIVNKLESGDCPLDESIKLFERGIELSEKCKKTLENAHCKIISLTDTEAKDDNQ